jgi:signal peptidase
MSFVKKGLKLIVDILTFLVFLVLIVIIFAKLKMMISGNDYFELAGYSVFSVKTGSMAPAINQNDVILVKSQDYYEMGDIITYKEEKSYITHRIISVRGHDIITQGDANNAKDSSITDDMVIGKVVKIYSNLGVWQKVVTTPKIIIMIFVTLMLFDIAFSYKGIRRKQNIKIADRISDIAFEKVLNIENAPKLTKKEIKVLKDKAEQVKKGGDVVFDKKEKQFVNYTIRLDLGELKKEIDENVNGDI